MRLDRLKIVDCERKGDVFTKSLESGHIVFVMAISTLTAMYLYTFLFGTLVILSFASFHVMRSVFQIEFSKQ